MRPAAQPAIVYLLYKIASIFGDVNPYHFAFFLRVISASLFILISVRVWERFAPALADQQLARWLALGLLFNWCSVYSGIRFSGENWSGMAFALGFLAYPMQWHGQQKNIFTPSKKAGYLSCFVAGLLLGVAFLFRYQVAIMVVGFLGWLLFVSKENWERFGLVLLGGMVAVAFGTLVDRWFYGEWVFAPWNYLRVNLIEGKAATFGTAPWWDYFRLVFERGVPPISLLYLIAPIWFAWRFRKDPLSWMMVPFLLVHFLLSRKDVRFLFPLLPWIPVMIIAGIQALRRVWGREWTEQVWARRGIGLLWGFNLLVLLTVLFRPMLKEVQANKYVYDNYEVPVTIMADGRHIYSYSNLTINFYQPKDTIIIHQTTTRAEWPACTTPVCLYSQLTRTPSPPENARLLYTNRPRWADDLGLKSWLDKISWWYIYELPGG